MDPLDLNILNALRTDARVSVSTLARRLGVARTTVQARIERLERDKLITAYTIRMGDQARATRIRATVLLTVEPRAAAAMIQRLRRMPEVEVAHTASGRYDLILQVSAPTTADLDATLDVVGEIPGVRSSESLIHLSTKIDRGS